MRFSVHVDAGYLYAALATRVTGSANRAAIKVDDSALIGELRRIAAQDCGGEPLRLLWYDAGSNGQPDRRQEAIGMLDGVKLRMGRVSPAGDQKGVDLRLGLDLVSLSNTQSVGIAYVVSGDDDLSEAVSDAQDRGLQIRLISVPGPDGTPLNVARHLRLTVEGVLLLPDEVIDRVVSRVVVVAPVKSPSPMPPTPRPVAEPVVRPTVLPPAGPPAPRPGPQQPAPTHAEHRPPVPASPIRPPVPVYSTVSEQLRQANGYEFFALDEEAIDKVAAATYRVWVESAGAEERATVTESRPMIPAAVDRLLLQDLVNRSGVYDIPEYARHLLRRAFWQCVDRAAAGS